MAQSTPGGSLQLKYPTGVLMLWVKMDRTLYLTLISYWVGPLRIWRRQLFAAEAVPEEDD